MDPIKQTTEHHIHIQDFQHQEKKITKEQERILFQLHLANILLFDAHTLNPEQQYHSGIVVSNDGTILKVQSDCYLNKKKKEWVRSFSTVDWRSCWFLLTKDSWWDETTIQKFFIVIPEYYTVKSTGWIPKEALDEINEIYKQAGDDTTCYDLVNNLKYWNPKDTLADLPF